MKNADMPAMPGQVKSHGNGVVEILSVGGLTKREMFAAMAMQAYITRISGCDLDAVAFDSVIAADALLAALEPKP